VEGSLASPFFFLVRAAVIVERSVDSMKEAVKKLMKAAQITATHGTVHTTYAAALRITTHPKTRCRKSSAAT